MTELNAPISETTTDVDPDLDLVLERTVDVAPELVWRAWTEAELLKQWFAPQPWTTTDATVEPVPGGRFDTTMRSPEGDEYPSAGCVLAVEPGRRLVFSPTMAAGFRPQVSDGGPQFTGVITIEADGTGTRYTAVAKHADAESRKAHADMGFLDGWGMALDQLVAVARGL